MYTLNSISRAALLVVFLWVPSTVLAQANLTSPGKPSWISTLTQSTDTGNFQLKWKPVNGDVVNIYRLTEVFQGVESVAYMDGTTQDFFRGEPGV